MTALTRAALPAVARLRAVAWRQSVGWPRAAAGAVRGAVQRLGPRGVATVVVQFGAVCYLTVVASLLFWSHAPELIGWQPRVVLTGSMMPVIRPGDVSVIAPAQPGPTTLPKGRIVLVRDASMRSGFYLHRVLRYDSQGRVITKGDANPTEDTTPVLAIQIAGQLRLVVPLVGLPVVWLQNKAYLELVSTALLTWGALTVVAKGAAWRPAVPGRRRTPARAGARRDVVDAATPSP